MNDLKASTGDITMETAAAALSESESATIPAINSVVHQTVPQNKVKTLIFYVTNRCNFRCNHCYYWQSLNVKDVLSFDEIKKFVDTIGDLDTLLIAGGEPFLRKELPEICEYFIEKCHLRLLSIPTNGSMDERIFDLIKRIHTKCKLRIYISLDGLKETHNRIRQVDSFDKCMAVLRRMVELKKEYDFTPMANITVSNQNIQEIDGLAELLNKVGVHYSVVPLRGSPKDSNLRPPTSEEWGNLIKHLTEKRKFLGEEASFYDNKINVFKRLHRQLLTKSKTRMYQQALDGKRNFICRAGEDTGVIDYEANVFFCEMTKKIGNLKDFGYDFNKLWFSEQAEAFRPQVKACVCSHGCFIRSNYMKATEWFTGMLYPVV